LLGELAKSVKYLIRHFPGQEAVGAVLDVIDVLYPDEPKPLLTRKIKTNGSWLLIFTLQPGTSFEELVKAQKYFEDATRKPIMLEQKNGFVSLEVFDDDLKEFYPYEWNPEPYLEKMSLPFPVGYSHRGLEVCDLASLPHILDAGTTFSGKSTFLHGLVASLGVLPNVCLAVIDLALLEFSYVKPYAFFAGEVDTALALLKYVEKEMFRRRAILEREGVVKIQDYKKKDLPFIVLIIDEFSFFNPAGIADKEEKSLRQQCHRSVANIAAMARKVGIHLVIATQRPDRDTLPGNIKANLPGVLAFKTVNRKNSEIILDDGAAAELPNVQGRVIWQVGVNQKEIQVMYCSPEQAKKILKERGLIKNDWFNKNECKAKRLAPR